MSHTQTLHLQYLPDHPISSFYFLWYSSTSEILTSLKFPKIMNFYIYILRIAFVLLFDKKLSIMLNHEHFPGIHTHTIY